MSGNLVHAPSDIVRNLMVDLSLGTTPSTSGSWPIYATREPNSPDSVITVFDTQGMVEGRFHVDGQVQEHYGIQIRVRDANPVDGYTKAQTIAVTLDQTAYQNTVTISSTTYTVHSVSRTGSVLALGKEVSGITGISTNRNIFTLNVVVDMRQIT